MAAAVLDAAPQQSDPLQAPFPYFGGKRKAAATVWAALGGDVKNYVEPFAGSAAMLLAAPEGQRVETINDADGFVANFWRAVAHDPDAVAHHADWPVNETDLFARHSWLVRQAPQLTERLHADPDYYDSRMAGWWCWGACSWIGSGWCSGTGPWVHDGERLVKRVAVKGVSRQLPHLGDAGKGVNKQLPHLCDEGKGMRCAAEGLTRSEFISAWMGRLRTRLCDVRVACGDWQRVIKDSVTTRFGLTAIFLDPPYSKGAMDYAAGGVGTDLPLQVQAWCAANGANPQLRIVLCGHAGEHDALLAHGWHTRAWKAGGGYALTAEANANRLSETVWCSPHCVPAVPQAVQDALFF